MPLIFLNRSCRSQHSEEQTSFSLFSALFSCQLVENGLFPVTFSSCSTSIEPFISAVDVRWGPCPASVSPLKGTEMWNLTYSSHRNFDLWPLALKAGETDHKGRELHENKSDIEVDSIRAARLKMSKNFKLFSYLQRSNRGSWEMVRKRWKPVFPGEKDQSSLRPVIKLSCGGLALRERLVQPALLLIQ